MKVIYKDVTKPIKQRVEDLLSKMTTSEKAAQMMQLPYSKMPRQEALKWAEKGVGSFLHVLGDNARELQETARNTRLGIPVLFGIDAIHGHGLNNHATIFPTQLALACTWSRTIAQEVGNVTAREVATDGLHWTFSPLLCLGRDPRWGRINETFGEDPYLVGELGAAMIKGYQGSDLNDGEHILACAKHYIGYGEALGGRDACDTQMTFRKMKDLFLSPFKKAVDAGCATIMTAYGSIDGTPFTASEKSLKEILKNELHFNGFVITDWDNVNSLVTYQKVAKDAEEASWLAVKAGNDMIMTSTEFYDAVIKLVENGNINEKLLDDAVQRILTIKFQMGLFEHPEKTGKPGCFGCNEHLEISKHAARQSIVLLKNQDILPIKKEIRKIAVIGSNADDIRAQYGDWTYFTHPEPHPEQEPIRPYVTIVEGMKQLAKETDVEISYHYGCSVIDETRSDLESAEKAAQSCDVVVMVIGDVIEQIGEIKDRANLDLSGLQQQLFDRIKRSGKPIVTVLAASKPLCIGKIAEQTDALLVSFNGGMFGGLAVAETIFGKSNPSGRLPISFPYHSGQIPVYYNSLPGWHNSPDGKGKYMDMPETPLFSFGQGITYTSFEYSQMSIDENSLSASINVKNTGQRYGQETIQVYFTDCVSSVMTPVKQLIAFKKIALDPGEDKTVTFKFDQSDFSLVNKNEERVIEPGEFILWIGADSRDESLKCKRFIIK